MTKRILSIISIVMITSIGCFAQRPVMHVKLLAGYNLGTVKYKTETSQLEFNQGFQAGLGLRVSIDRKFYELDILFRRSTFELLEESRMKIIEETGADDPVIFVNAIKLPVVMGYKVVKTPLFKWTVQGGVALTIGLKSKIFDDGEKIDDYDVKEIGLTNPRIAMRMGTGIDLAFFSFDFSYDLGLNNALTTVIRAHTHDLEFTMGIIF